MLRQIKNTYLRAILAEAPPTAFYQIAKSIAWVWHIGPTIGQANKVSGEIYIIDTEDDSGEDEIRCTHCNALGKPDELGEYCAFQRGALAVSTIGRSWTVVLFTNA